MVKNKFDIRTFFDKRPLSWSSISGFEYNKEIWYKKYFLGIKERDTPELIFGKVFAHHVEKRKPLAPVTIYSKVEEPLNVCFNGIKMCGFMDTYEPHTHLVDHKTGVKVWDHKRAQETGQLKMYKLMLWITHKVKPEDILSAIEWVPTQKKERNNGDFSGFDYTIKFVEPIRVHRFEVRHTMHDIVMFGVYINDVVDRMEKYISSMI
jgi:hypothetical protein